MLASSTLLQAGCQTVDTCCAPPVTTTEVAVTWTIDGAPPATGCAAAAATTVRFEIFGPGVPQKLDVSCSTGVASIPSTVFLPSTDGSHAGAVVGRLLGPDGVEISARRLQLTWQAQVVSALLPIVTPPPDGGTVRYGWCEPIPAGHSLRVQGDGPMLVEAVAAAPSTELVFGPLAPGQYTFRELTAAGLPGIGPADANVMVTTGLESLLRVYPCKPL